MTASERSTLWLAFLVGGGVAVSLLNLYRLYRVVRLEEDLADELGAQRVCVHLHAEDRVDHAAMPVTRAELDAEEARQRAKGGDL